MKNLTAFIEKIRIISWINSLFVVICLLAYSFFPANNFLQGLTKEIFFLFLIPILYIRYLLKKPISAFGLAPKKSNFKNNALWSMIMLLISLGIFYFLATFTPFGKEYYLSPSIKGNFWLFIGYELVLVNLLFFFQEYFFKGFLIALLRKRFDYFAIVIQAILYLVPLWLVSSSLWQTIPLSILALTGGFLAYRTRSFFFSYAMGILFLFIADSYIIFINR